MPIKTTKIANRDNPLMAEVRAVVFSGLAITKASGLTGVFRVTHQQSGLAVGGYWSLAMTAYRFAKQIAPLADWTQDGKALAANKKLAQKIEAVGRKMRANRPVTITY